MIGETLSHYRIIERVGGGGMGVVYRARDERLDRDVAVKVLAADLLSDKAAGTRFRQEARALSRINHPNICAVYDFDSERGVSFLAMEYIAGRTLADVVRSGPMAETEILPLAMQLAEGLAAAHREGVVHRDLKPSNLALSADGRLKILDFGLAKLSQTAPPDGATLSVLETKGIAGTVPYMAPEQLRAGAVDARTDVYAAGVVLYELATGRRPFDDPNMPALTDAILHAAPIPPVRLRPEISPALEGVILRCLEKDPALRYQSAGDLLADLKRHQAKSSSAAVSPLPASRPRLLRARRPIVAFAILLLALAAGAFAFNLFGVRDRLSGRPPGAAQPIESLGVLPFENLSRDASQDYFVAGMTEALTAAVSQIPTLRVIGRASMMRFAGARPSIPEIARLTGVDAVIEGSALRDGNRVRITAQLVAARPERHLWSNSYDRDVRDVLAIHGEVAQAIAREIRTKLSPEAQMRLARARPVNPGAYEAYLRGRAVLANPSAGSFVPAEAAFKQAIALDANFAEAYSSLAYVYMVYSFLGEARLSPRDQASRVRGPLARALELDPSLPEALAVEGTLNLYWDWDWPTAERRLKRALELNPSEGLLYHPYADYLLVMGRLEESLEVVKRGAALDPLSPLTNGVVAGHLLFARRWDEALDQVRRMSAQNPRLDLRNFAADALWGKGDYRGTLDELMPPPNPLGDAARRALSSEGPRAAARVIARAFASPAPPAVPRPLQVAEWYSRAGDADSAMKWLEIAYGNRAPFLLHIKANATFDPVRDDPRFVALLKRIGFPD